jgi:hypothetical protein
VESVQPSQHDSDDLQWRRLRTEEFDESDDELDRSPGIGEFGKAGKGIISTLEPTSPFEPGYYRKNQGGIDHKEAYDDDL